VAASFTELTPVLAANLALEAVRALFPAGL